MAELLTKPTNQDVRQFLDKIPEEGKRRDCYTVLDLMRQATESEPVLWGTDIVGFGNHHLKYASGRECDWFLVGFAPRKQNLTLYLTYGFDADQERLQRLGKVKTGKACLYIKKIEDIDLTVLRDLIEDSVRRQSGS